MRWVFVCTANISRSPYAERRMAQLLGEQSSVVVSSAGIPGFDGRSMEEPMLALLEARGGSGADHESQILTDEIVAEADLIIPMTFAHHMAIVEKWPSAASKVKGLGQLAAGAPRNSMAWDVADPYRRGKRAARKAADEIDGYLKKILPLVQ